MPDARNRRKPEMLINFSDVTKESNLKMSPKTSISNKIVKCAQKPKFRENNIV